MVKEKLLQAKALMEQERYAEAQKLLRSIDHPTAKHWLQRMEAFEPRHSKANNGGGTTTFVILMVVVLVIIGGGMLVVLPRLNAVAIPTVDTLPILVDLPTAAPGGYPCERQQWWDENAATVNEFFQNPLFFGDEKIPQSRIDGAIRVMEQNRINFAAAEYPICLQDLRDEILATMDTWYGVYLLPQFFIVDWEVFTDYETTDILLLGTAAADAMDGLIGIMKMLDAEAIAYDTAGLDGDGYLGRYREGNTAECPALRWLMTDYYISMLLSGQVALMINAVDERVPTEREVRELMGDLQRERTRLEAEERPSCVAVQHELVVDSTYFLLRTLQSYFTEGITYQTALRINEYMSALYPLQSTAGRLDTLGILPETFK